MLSKRGKSFRSQYPHILRIAQCPLPAISASSSRHARCTGCSPAELVVKGLLRSMGSRQNSQRSIAGSCCPVMLDSALTTGQSWAGPSRMRHAKPSLCTAALVATIGLLSPTLQPTISRKRRGEEQVQGQNEVHLPIRPVRAGKHRRWPPPGKTDRAC
jgi:hypothetical protein